MPGEELSIGEHFSRGTVSGDAAGEQDRAVAGFCRHVEVVCGEEKGEVGTGIQPFDQAPAMARIEIARRFVEREQCGTHGKDGGNGGAAAFSETQVRGIAFGGRVESHSAQRFRHALVPFIPFDAVRGGTEGHVVANGG